MSTDYGGHGSDEATRVFGIRVDRFERDGVVERLESTLDGDAVRRVEQRLDGFEVEHPGCRPGTGETGGCEAAVLRTRLLVLGDVGEQGHE